MVHLDVFVSWSGALSHAIGRELHAWFPKVLPGVKPWISSEDIAKGKPWFLEIATQLGSSPVCVVCITRNNVGSPWLYYEAGAIAFAMDDAYVCPFLIDAGAESIRSTPFGQFQATLFDRDDTLRLVKTINARLPKPNHATVLCSLFDKTWPGLNSTARVPF
jgi:hypothetical protein